MKSILSTQEPRYRSVKYKLNRDISTAINQCSIDKKILLPSTAKNSLMKPRRNGNKFSVSHITDFRSSVLNCESPEDDKMKRTTYMDTFHFMLNMERNRYNAKEKDREEYQENQRSKINSNQELPLRPSRVQLPVLNQLDSHFTVLDNIHLPIDYINEEITRINKQMAVEGQNVKKIAHQIKEIQKKTIRSIEQISEMGTKGFEKLRNLLKGNKVYHQEEVLKQKSALEKSREYLPDYYRSLEKSKQDLRVLQDTIFKGVPFELQQLPEFELISTKYF